MAYLAILAMGGFGTVIAVLGHYAMKRERAAILAAREDLAKSAERSGGPGDARQDAPLVAVGGVRKAGAARLRFTQAAPKQYKRERV